MDYGNPIQLGTFVTPTSQAPRQGVQLAQLSERLGYDLVTYQDHPYQPAFLDTWTLMSYAAAATQTIQIAPNVLNLPLRPAPMIAKAAASLDLLSGGRFALGLGAGAFWDAIEAMGAKRLTPGQAVDALEEAIEVIRGLWDTQARGTLRGGDHYPVNGAKRGPAPAHEIPIWLGALKPRMQRLIGRTGDGWLPSLSYLKPGDLARGNAIIDEAAEAAGRDPREIRRMLNIAGTEPLEQLTEFALEHGVSTFIIGGDDPDLMERFARESGPALRDAVAAERARTGTERIGRSSKARAARREGIDYDGVPTSLASHAVEPGDFDYASVKSTYLRGGAPGIVLRPQSIPEVVDAVAFARGHRDLPLGVRSGGHGISGRSTNDGGIVIDVGALDQVEVLDEENRLVRVGPGARWGQVAAALAPYGWAISSGDSGDVGVGGLATAGGIGMLGRSQGLTIDRLRAAEVVLADGSLVRTSPSEHPDLFWAIRGAGANIGIVVAFEFEAGEVGPVGWVQLIFDASDTAGFLTAFGRAQEEADPAVTLFAILQRARDGVIAQVYGMVASSDPDEIVAHLQPFAQLAPLLGQQVQVARYHDVVASAGQIAHRGQGEPRFRSGLVAHLDENVAHAMAALVSSGAAAWFQLRPLGGAIADVDPGATAFAHRDAGFSVTAVGRGRDFEDGWDQLAAQFTGSYLSFETRTGPETVAQAFPPATLERLQRIKREVDPTTLFRDNVSVAESETPLAAPAQA